MPGIGTIAKAAGKKLSKKSKKGKSYTLGNTTKARVKLGVVGSRAILAYKDLAKAAAAGENTKIMRGIRHMYSGTSTDGGKLKEGMIGMLDRIGATTEEYNAIMGMDEELLAKMYDSNDITFEVFFNYEGITKMNGTYFVSEEKRQDVQWFIDQYNKVASTQDRKTFIDSFGIDTI